MSKKTYFKICQYCGNSFSTLVKRQKFCSINCNKAETLKRSSGKIKCIKCWLVGRIEDNSDERICDDCKAERSKRTLDNFSSDELLHYGKVQAERFMKSQKESR